MYVCIPVKMERCKYWAEEIEQERKERATAETGPKEDLRPLPQSTWQ